MNQDHKVETVEARVLGRYLVSPPVSHGRAPLLVGFHGYGDNAERNLIEMRRLPGASRWLLVSVDALHRFYSSRWNTIVGCWMTRQDREAAIANNLAYVGKVIENVKQDWNTTGSVVFLGFSQGVAMAYRAALRIRPQATGVIALAGDVPPELQSDHTVHWPKILVGRGVDDTWYTAAKLEADLSFLRTVGSSVESLEFTGGHEWTDEFRFAAGGFLARCSEASRILRN